VYVKVNLRRAEGEGDARQGEEGREEERQRQRRGSARAGGGGRERKKGTGRRKSEQVVCGSDEIGECCSSLSTCGADLPGKAEDLEMQGAMQPEFSQVRSEEQGN
jgi:hypothetical protein